MRTFVLIPGVGCGGWAWRPTAKLLEQAGHRAAALTLPGLRFDTPDPAATLREAVQYVVDHVQTHSPEAVTLVAHSWGGYPATAAAAALGPAQVEELVYYNAVVPASGVPMVDENTQMSAYLRHTLTQGPTIPLNADTVTNVLMPGEDPVAQDLVASLVTSTPGGYILGSVDGPSVVDLGIPARYILGAQDISLARPGAEFAARIGLQPRIVEGSHMAMFTRPTELARVLLEDR